uniref:Kinesin-like protein n=1 Tax=Albugo laibachii Nc14 TaxID=890382 RepID=F0WQ41_9STRA|nr:kinesinlike protein KIF22A putative [Albugo laibachii Nc14]|eukprot:CCA23446.1 kinesinlike protein KIF22A putative [Albugo laibachii Nc14]
MATENRKKGKERKRKRVHVIVRVRPLLPHEKLQPRALEVAKKSSQVVQIELISPSAPNTQVYTFEKCYEEHTPQRLLFQKEIMPIVKTLFKGIHTTVFAYGATGTGKTFTMEGSKRNLGIIPRCLKFLFQYGSNNTLDEAESIKKNAFKSFRVTMSYFEIYNDKIHDLLDPKCPQTLTIRQANESIEIPGLSKKVIGDLNEFQELYASASARRRRASTKLNDCSSRSHSILMIQVQTRHSKNELTIGKLQLIDLAGSEDNRRTGNTGIRMGESKEINKSLFVLGQVLTALDMDEVKRIPFRESKLTRVLQDSLGGENRAVMICNVAPVAKMHQETIQTLNYAAKAQGPNSVTGIKSNKIKDVSSVKAGVSMSTKMERVVQSKASKDTAPSTSFSKPKITGRSNSKRPDCAKQLKRISTASILQQKSKRESMENKLQQWKQIKQGNRSSSESLLMASKEIVPTGRKRKLSETKSTPFSTTKAIRVPLKSSKIAGPSNLRASKSAIEPQVRAFQTQTSKISPHAKDQCHSGSNSFAFREPHDPETDAKDPGTREYREIEQNQLEIAKKLVATAVEFERKEYYWSSLCTFRKACRALPTQNDKLAARVTALEAKCDELSTIPLDMRIEMKQNRILALPTPTYMQRVFENNVLEVLNAGTFDEVTTLPTIGEKRALKIMQARPFRKIAELNNVPGITQKMIDKMQQQHVQDALTDNW